ncbi:hypothetical protein A1F94_005639 [Pyrenophora tritici-repentis]|uniref:Uncharacterized protein n=1 Tax=Pyrenophora tritici-repentis TaxID=45151 RepID=A0A5M9L6D4_9PLEO|nr:hypothetical protein PtrV1_08289 [Pyrenophora tritici-repentis]KAF7449326.1 hypothetical protein A1F99_063750 [Pyrenophora tritici-repentis]KAG9383728.1 hypothetical protein A1F94_005639 [Pyrenophora tritici-repentis]KAI0585251.1 hypothetical protein Alg215_02642 [Pyrenophora tritici-repentis]KAI0590841.1 hypothetical protein Alg130_01873 [Pyrenophora tritici-repentis]
MKAKIKRKEPVMDFTYNQGKKGKKKYDIVRITESA